MDNEFSPPDVQHHNPASSRRQPTMVNQQTQLKSRLL